eukprot:221351-Amphidinium_carterae.1
MGSHFWSKPGGEPKVLLTRLVQYIIIEVPTARDSPVGHACSPPTAKFSQWEDEEKASLMSARTGWQTVVRKNAYRRSGAVPAPDGDRFPLMCAN